MDAAPSERKERIARSMAEYWDRLRGERPAPRRSEVDPSAFQSSLEHMFILEDVTNGPVRFRLTGSAVGQVMGMELRGMPLRAIFQRGEARRIDDLLRDLLDMPATCDLTVECEHGEGTMILRPLTDDFGTVNRILGCVVFDSDTPVSMPILSIGAVKFSPMRDMSAPRAQPVAFGFSEDQAPFGHPHLRVIAGAGSVPSERQPRPALRVVSREE